MVLLVIGILVFIASFSLGKLNPPLTQYATVVRSIGLIIVAIGFLTSCIKQIDAGEKFFLSIIPFWGINKNTKERIMYSGNPESD